MTSTTDSHQPLDMIFCGTRTGAKVHLASPGGSSTLCGVWLRAQASRMQRRGATVAGAAMEGHLCESCMSSDLRSDLRDIAERAMNRLLAVREAGERDAEPAIRAERDEAMLARITGTRTANVAGSQDAEADEPTYCTVHEAGACYEGCPHAYAGELEEAWDDQPEPPEMTTPAYEQYVREQMADDLCPRCGKALGMDAPLAGVVMLADYGNGETGPMPVEEITATHATCVRTGDRVQVALNDGRHGLVRVAAPAGELADDQDEPPACTCPPDTYSPDGYPIFTPAADCPDHGAAAHPPATVQVELTADEAHQLLMAARQALRSEHGAVLAAAARKLDAAL